jgi:hypothetical protein
MIRLNASDFVIPTRKNATSMNFGFMIDNFFERMNSRNYSVTEEFLERSMELTRLRFSGTLTLNYT